MEGLHGRVAISVNENVFLKDPTGTELGRRIVRASIDLIDDLGFEDFTFKKLALAIGSTEASVYRYFENKHNLLAYLTMWYWGWMEYRIVMSTLNIEDPKVRLRNAIKALTESIEEDSTFSQVNEVKLNQIVIREGSKVYFSKQVVQDNKVGFFKVYKDLVQRVADIILEINPTFKYPHMLVSTIVEGSRHQRYFAENLPRLTDIVKGEDAVITFFTEMAEREIGR